MTEARRPSYGELLRHPKWQRKRLEILQRDGFACIDCHSTERTLNVHHTYYRRGLDPWDYPSDSLQSLCERCHKMRHDSREEWKRLLDKMLPLLDVEELQEVVGYVMGCSSIELRVTSELPSAISALGYADRLQVSWDGFNSIAEETKGAKIGYREFVHRARGRTEQLRSRLNELERDRTAAES